MAQTAAPAYMPAEAHGSEQCQQVPAGTVSPTSKEDALRARHRRQGDYPLDFPRESNPPPPSPPPFTLLPAAAAAAAAAAATPDLPAALEEERLAQVELDREEEAIRQEEYEREKDAARVREEEARRQAHHAAATAQQDWGFCASCGVAPCISRCLLVY